MCEVNSIIVFGCESSVGQQILRRGILEGLEVTAFTNDPQKIPLDIRKKVKKINGDIGDGNEVQIAIKCHDAVLAALEPTKWFSNGKAMLNGCRNIVSGMKEHHIKRFIIVSNAFDKHRFSMLNNILKEETTSIDWVLVAAPKIRNSTYVDPDYKVEEDLDTTDPEIYSATRAEIADFLVKVCMDRTEAEKHRHRTIGISSPLRER